MNDKLSNDTINASVPLAEGRALEHPKQEPKIRRKRQLMCAGIRFGRLVVQIASYDKAGRRNRALCRCDCGEVVKIRHENLVDGHSRSCGCLAREQMSVKMRTHGMRHTPEYRTWMSMMTRCYNPNHDSYQHYGGRGILVCERWHKFEHFFSDMGARPSGTSLDRINVNGNY